MFISIPVAYAALLALVTFAVLARALYLKLETDDIPSTYRLFAARDALVRLVIEKKIDRNDPYFDVMYTNVVLLLRSSRLLSGPSGWPLAHYSGKVFARHPDAGAKLRALPPGPMPDVLCPIADDLAAALHHLLQNHFGIYLQRDTRRREAIKLQKQKARQFLDILPGGHCAGHA